MENHRASQNDAFSSDISSQTRVFSGLIVCCLSLIYGQGRGRDVELAVWLCCKECPIVVSCYQRLSGLAGVCHPNYRPQSSADVPIT